MLKQQSRHPITSTISNYKKQHKKNNQLHKNIINQNKQKKVLSDKNIKTHPFPTNSILKQLINEEYDKNSLKENKINKKHKVQQAKNQFNQHYHLISQTSVNVNDLSEIVPLDMIQFNSYKKDIENNQFNQDDQIQIVDVYFNNKEILEENKDDEDIQILGISSYNQTIECQEQSEKRQENKNKNKNKIEKIQEKKIRTTGIIRRNSKLSNPLSYQTQNHFNDQIQIKILLCGRKVFDSILRMSHLPKPVIKEIDLRRSALDSDIKVILGPIMSKFNLNKYNQLNEKQFIDEFRVLFDDFTMKQKLQIIDKIIDMGKQQHQSNRSQQARLQKQTTLKQIENNKSILITDMRLRNLHDKVDSFLNKIRSPSEQNFNKTINKKSQDLINQLNDNKKQPISQLILMSELSQIKQISNDSENIIQLSVTQIQSNTSHSFKLQRQNMDSHSLSSFNKIGLQFNELEKYLND